MTELVVGPAYEDKEALPGRHPAQARYRQMHCPGQSTQAFDLLAVTPDRFLIEIMHSQRNGLTNLNAYVTFVPESSKNGGSAQAGSICDLGDCTEAGFRNTAHGKLNLRFKNGSQRAGAVSARMPS